MKVFKKIFLFGLAFFGTMAGLDVYLQLAEIQTPMETRVDARLGPVYIPNKRITRFNEGFFMGSVNKYGYMGPAVSPRRVSSERRILLLGDSFVLGHTVLPRDYFGRYLEEELSRTTGEEIRALNFGRADFSLENMYQNYKDFAGSFDHDLALFFLAKRDLMPWAQTVSRLYPTVRLQSDEIVIDRGFRLSASYRFNKAIEPLFTRSAILRLTFNTYKIIVNSDWRSFVPEMFLRTVRPGNEAFESAVSPPIEKLPELKLAILRELSHDSRNVLVIQAPIPSGMMAEVRASGLPVIYLGFYLEQQRSLGRDPYLWPVTRMRGHWNHAAQPQIGKFLSDQIVSLGLLKGK